MRFINYIYVSLLIFALSVKCLFSTDFTVASYNCGGLSDHYDYIRAACLEDLTQERKITEPETNEELKKIQNLALKILFSKDPKEVLTAEEKWNKGGFSPRLRKITQHPGDIDSINRIWREKSEEIVSTYKERPVVIYDDQVRNKLIAHVKKLSEGQNHQDSSRILNNDAIEAARRSMTVKIFKDFLNCDLIALQEADYLDPSMFPENYEVRFSQTEHSINGVAWNTHRFDLIEVIGNIGGRGYVVKLLDRETDHTVLVASGHLAGCNPFYVVNHDGDKGDQDLQQILQTMERQDADIKIIAMDSNVTAIHPRMSILKNANYTLDYENYLEPTCTNPWQILDTRIDWIVMKSDDETLKISNIPVVGVDLNSLERNISDHKPVASRIYTDP